MNKEKRAIILGMALGDGYIQVRQRMNGKYEYESRSMTVLHGSQQRLYCEYKAKRLGWALGGRQINVRRQKNGPGGKYVAYAFCVSHPYFGQVKRWLYPEGRKRIGTKVLDMLNAESLALWYMDDGSARRNTNSKGVVSSCSTDIATMCSRFEAEAIVDWFRQVHGIHWKIRRRRASPLESAFFLECNTEMSHRFIELVKPHIPDCMKYKISHVSDVNSQERQTPVGSCIECEKPIFENRRKGLCTACYSRQCRAMR